MNNELVINHINILTMADNQIQHNKLVLVKDGCISAIDDGTDDAKHPNVVDGRGKYLMPGLINMHTHLGDNPHDLMLYLVNGVTAIRNMWGYEGFRLRQWAFGTRVFHHLRLRQQIESGEIAGPAIFTAGPLLDGKDPFFPKFMCLHALASKEQTHQVIKDQSSKGYDFIKIYSNLSRQNFDDIMEIAALYGMPVTGHVPDAVGIKHALKSGLRSIEHLYGFFNPYNPGSNIRKEEVKELAGIAARNHVWNCPTLIANERIANTEKQNEFEDEDEMQYIPNRNKKAMRFLIRESRKLFDKKGVRGNHEYMEFLYMIVRQLHSEGAGLLLGTDKAVPYVVAGFSEHREMKLLSKAGLSNYEVIKTATINAAHCLHRENELGTIEIGKRANMIITDTNPLDDLKTIFHHAGVIKDGVYYTRERCDAILNGVRRNKVNITPQQ